MICRTCGNNKEENEFYSYDLGECKSCRNAASREYNATHKATCYQDHYKYRRTLKWKLANLRAEQRIRTGKPLTEWDDLTLEELEQIFVESKLEFDAGLKCACCGVDVTEIYEIDHRTSVKNGGKLTKGNLQILCPKCNAEKHTKNVYYFRVVAYPISGLPVS